MELKRIAHTCFGLGAALVAVSIGSAVMAADILTAADPASMGQWYGRAGGLVGSDRVVAIAKGAKVGNPVRITYDKDVAERTNMHRQETANGVVTIIYDKDVAARTNMPRGDNTEQPTRAVGVPEKGNRQD
jgi:hypothetical protein